MRNNKNFRGLLVVTTLLVGATSCDFIAGGSELNLEYCQTHPDVTECQNYCAMHAGDTHCPDAGPGIDAAQQCTTSTQCTTAPYNTCDIATMTCVDCVANTDCSAGTMPICAADHTCRACTTNTECRESELCLPDGSCALSTQTAYVDSTVGTDGDCTKASPCKTLAKGLGKKLLNVKVKGATTEPAATISVASDTKFVIGDSNPTVTVSSSGAAFELLTGANIAFYDIGIRGNGTTFPFACVSIAGGQTATFTMIRGTLAKCQTGLINTMGGTVTVTGATVTANTGAGITSMGGTVTVTGATVTANNAGGLDFKTGVVKLVNNFIVRNGSSSAITGGVSLAALTSLEFDFNTVADNQSDGIANAGIGGIRCAGSVKNISNSIVARNRTDIAVVLAGQNSGCILNVTIATEDSTSLKFVNEITAPYDYHLKAGSSAIDTATFASTVAVDFDGNVRPTGAGKDQGADEVQ
jgi:hypothetical protein